MKPLNETNLIDASSNFSIISSKLGNTESQEKPSLIGKNIAGKRYPADIGYEKYWECDSELS